MSAFQKWRPRQYITEIARCADGEVEALLQDLVANFPGTAPNMLFRLTGKRQW